MDVLRIGKDRNCQLTCYFDHYFTSTARAEHNTRAQCTWQQLGNLL